MFHAKGKDQQRAMQFGGGEGTRNNKSNGGKAEEAEIIYLTHSTCSQVNVNIQHAN
jgi:hypothetical protein